MSKFFERFLILLCMVCFVTAATWVGSAHGQVPATKVQIWGLSVPAPQPPSPFGPVLIVSGADGTERWQVNTLGDVVFQPGSTVQYGQFTTHAGHIRGFVYIKLPNGEPALMPVFALPGDTREYDVSIDP